MPAAQLFTGVNRPADSERLTQLEQMHVPVITAPSRARAGERLWVTIEVGKLYAHPNEHTHFIEFVELYADDTFLARADLTAVSTSPVVTFEISLPGAIDELRAYARCNLHGVWTASSPLEIT